MDETWLQIEFNHKWKKNKAIILNKPSILFIFFVCDNFPNILYERLISLNCSC